MLVPDMPDATDAIKAAHSTIELEDALSRALSSHSVTAYAVGYLPGGGGISTSPFLLLTWPRAWLELYAREGFSTEDAVVAEARQAKEPFTWRELQARRPGASERIFAAARSFGWIDGLLIPIRVSAATGQPAVASLAMTSPVSASRDDRDYLEHVATLAFQRAVVLEKSFDTNTLTPREKEVLRLVAQGKSDREISDRLSVAAATANFHVEQAKRKLGAQSRAQAAVIASSKGLIS